MVFAFDSIINRYKRSSANDLREKKITFKLGGGGGRGGGRVAVEGVDQNIIAIIKGVFSVTELTFK